jgi:deoxycytidine triphosphate deaminase
MFLISKFVYEAMGKSKLHATSAYLRIHNYSPENHQQTFYKFRYGAPDVDGKVTAPSEIRLESGLSEAVWSLEGFDLSERVFGIFGHSSVLFKRGLELIHSPFVDPVFEGQLQLVVRNFSDHTVALTPGDILGKIMFFDISDTILSAADLMKEVQENTQNQVRQKAIYEMSQAMGNLGKL